MVNELILLKITVVNEGDEWVIRASTPVSFVELTVNSEEVAQQVNAQLGQRLLDTIESELEELKGDMES